MSVQKCTATGSRKIACAREVVGHLEHIALTIILLEICLGFMYRIVRECIYAFNLLSGKISWQKYVCAVHSVRVWLYDIFI